MRDSYDGNFDFVDGGRIADPSGTALDPDFNPDEYQDKVQDPDSEDDADSLGDWDDEEY